MSLLLLLLIGAGVVVILALGVGAIVLVKLGVLAHYAMKSESPEDKQGEFGLDQSHEVHKEPD